LANFIASIYDIAGNKIHLNFGDLFNLLKNQYIQMRLPCGHGVVVYPLTWGFLL